MSQMTAMEPFRKQQRTPTNILVKSGPVSRWSLRVGPEIWQNSQILHVFSLVSVDDILHDVEYTILDCCQFLPQGSASPREMMSSMKFT